MTPGDLCIRCQAVPADRTLDWLHCAACYQDACAEADDALRELEHDDISRLMQVLDLTFVEAVEMLAVERGVQEWPHPDAFWP
jgi:hypothetical protein